MACPSTVSDTRPSCGTRFSAMSRLAMIFTRETVPATMRRGMWVLSRSTPSTRKRTRMSRPSRLEVDVRGAVLDTLGDDRVHELDHGRVVRGLADLGDLVDLVLALLHRGGHGVVELAHAADQAVDVLDPGDHGQNLVAGHQLQVVEREHVRRVRHRDEQVSAVVEADRHRSEPARGRRADEVQRSHVGLVDREVDVLEAEALRHRARELVTGDGACTRAGPARAGGAPPCPPRRPPSRARRRRSRAPRARR